MTRLSESTLPSSSSRIGSTVTFKPAPKRVEAAAQPAPVTPAPAPRVPWKYVGLGAAGLGVLAMGVGGYFGLQAKSASDDSGCSGGRCPS